METQNKNNFWENFKLRLNQSIKDFKRKSLYRKKLIDMLTIQEAELVYTSYVSKNLKETYTDFQTRKQMKRDKSFSKIKLQIRMKVSNEKILYLVPRLNEVEY